MPADPTVRTALTVRLFARYAELLGAEEIAVAADGITTVRDLLAKLRQLPGGAAIGASTLVAVNLKQARLDSPVSPADEVAILPPLSGG